MVSHPDLLVGIETGDDAAVYRLDDKTAIIVTVDFFTPITDDPYEFGVVAAANSLSDVYAMGGKPLVALNVVGFPADLAVEMLGDVLKGGYDKATEAGCLIVGGHTVDDAEPKYGLSVVGLIEPGKEVSNANAKPGDVLVLTKPIGTGIVTTGVKQGVTPDAILKQAVDMMAELNKGASEAMMRVGVNSCTDITGFGLLGHLGRAVQESGVDAEIDVGAVPLLDGARPLAEAGAIPGGSRRNLAWVDQRLDRGDHDELDVLLLADAQTSGGLLFGAAPAAAHEALDRLEASGHVASVIGRVVEGDGRLRLA